jgi:hypothetical protein
VHVPAGTHLFEAGTGRCSGGRGRDSDSDSRGKYRAADGDAGRALLLSGRVALLGPSTGIMVGVRAAGQLLGPPSGTPRLTGAAVADTAVELLLFSKARARSVALPCFAKDRGMRTRKIPNRGQQLGTGCTVTRAAGVLLLQLDCADASQLQRSAVVVRAGVMVSVRLDS